MSIFHSIKGRVMDGDGNLNKAGIINSGKLNSYDPETGIFKLRIDDSNVPGFWIEIDINFENLKKYIKNEERNENFHSITGECIDPETGLPMTKSKMKKLFKIKNEKIEDSEYIEPPRLKEHCTGFNCVCWKRGIYDFCEEPKYNMCMICYNKDCIRSKKGHQEKCDKEKYNK